MHIDRGFGKFLRRKRIKAGVTQKSLAAKLGYHPQYIHNWEAGKASTPVSSIPMIAKLLGIHMDEIIIKLLELYKKRLHQTLK